MTGIASSTGSCRARNQASSSRRQRRMTSRGSESLVRNVMKVAAPGWNQCGRLRETAASKGALGSKGWNPGGGWFSGMAVDWKGKEEKDEQLGQLLYGWIVEQLSPIAPVSRERSAFVEGCCLRRRECRREPGAAKTSNWDNCSTSEPHDFRRPVAVGEVELEAVAEELAGGFERDLGAVVFG